MRHIPLKKTLSTIVAAAYLMGSTGSALACTALMYTDKQGNAYSAKTMEYSSTLPASVEYIPAGTKVDSQAPGGKPGMSFVTKYAIFGTAASLMKGANTDMVAEAINDRGLSWATLEFPGSKSPIVAGVDPSKVLASSDLGTYVLGNFELVADVKAALQSGDVKVWLPVLPWASSYDAPFHYVLFDRTGAGIVIEYANGVQNIYDNPVGVATNAPDFPWHLQNLNNYANLTNVDKNSGQFNKLKVSAPDSGNAMGNVPSGQDSPSRFVKAAFYANYVRKASTPDQAVITLAHIMNNFDRPYDLTIDKGNFFGDGPSGSANSSSSETTQYTFLHDKNRNRYYLRTIDAMNFAMFDLNKLATIKKTVKVPLTNINDQTLDGTQVMLDAANNQ